MFKIHIFYFSEMHNCGEDYPACFDKRDQVAMEAPAGSLVFFDPHSIHGSEPNRSAKPRRAMVLTYQPANFPMLKTGEVRNAG